MIDSNEDDKSVSDVKASDEARTEQNAELRMFAGRDLLTHLKELATLLQSTPLAENIDAMVDAARAGNTAGARWMIDEFFGSLERLRALLYLVGPSEPDDSALQREMARTTLDWPQPGDVEVRPGGGVAMTLAGGIDVYDFYEIETTDPQGLKIHAIVRLRKGRLRITQMVATSPETAEPVTGETLRKIPVQRLVREVFSDVVSPWQGMSNATRGPLASFRDDLRAHLREAGPVTETLQVVAQVYQAAYVLGDKPAKAVQEAFDVPRPTADRWIRKARDRGFLGAAAGAGKAGA